MKALRTDRKHSSMIIPPSAACLTHFMPYERMILTNLDSYFAMTDDDDITLFKKVGKEEKREKGKFG
eukprot:scaffold4087_cov172-Chaetoceros_neogracile.AAC.1